MEKKTHSIKNLLVVNLLAQVIFLSPTAKGSRHDKALADKVLYDLAPETLLYHDSAFQGLDLDVDSRQPIKKPRGRRLTPPEKEHNRQLARLRIRVEHAIAGVKRYRIVRDPIRITNQAFRDSVMATCCGLHNFRLRFRPFYYHPKVSSSKSA